MDMSSIGACRFIAVCARSNIVRAFAGFLLACTLAAAAECGAGLAPQEKVARFKQLDSEAEKAMRERRPTDAARLYKEAVCLVPDSARGYFGLGVAEAAAGNFLNARESLRSADRLQPTTGMPLVMQVRANFSLGDMDALKSNLREAASRFPNDTQLHATLARFLAERNLFVLALAEALRSQQQSANWNSTIQLAVLENTVGAYEDAIRNALAVEQDHQIPEQARGAAAGIAGLSYESLHQADKAVQYLREAIQLDPSQDNSYLALADLFEQQQKYQDAVNVLAQARTHIPGSPALLLALGADLVRAEHYQEGRELLRRLLQIAPNTPEAYISLADAARKTGDPAQEVAALRQLEHYKPGYPMIHVLVARAMLNLEPVQYPQILDELSVAAKTSPNDADVYFLQGKVYIALKRYDRAIPALQRSIELRPTDPSPYYQLARVYQKLGKIEMAKEQFARVKYLETANAK
jgi:tetratricopeptide (TPR) repeat protein